MSSTAEGHSFLVSGKCDAKKTPLTRFKGRLAIAEMGGEGSDVAIEVNCCIFIMYFQRVAYYCRCFHFIVLLLSVISGGCSTPWHIIFSFCMLIVMPKYSLVHEKLSVRLCSCWLTKPASSACPNCFHSSKSRNKFL